VRSAERGQERKYCSKTEKDVFWEAKAFMEQGNKGKFMGPSIIRASE